MQTSDGLKPIETITENDTVLSRNTVTGDLEYRPVVTTFVKHNQKIIQVTLENETGEEETIGTTEEHPFWLKDKGWTPATKLLPGDEVFTSKGGWLKVTGSTWLSGRQTVYNFEVEGLHNYFVGTSGALVHNSSKMEVPNDLKRRTSAENKKARNKFKNNKQKAREAWEKREGQDWPVDEHGNYWPAEHTPPLKEGGDPMVVTPRDPGAPDPHSIPGPDGLTDYQRWGAEGTPVREANRKRK